MECPQRDQYDGYVHEYSHSIGEACMVYDKSDSDKPWAIFASADIRIAALSIA